MGGRGFGLGADSAEARNKLEKRGASPPSAARCVGRRLTDWTDTFAHSTAKQLRRRKNVPCVSGTVCAASADGQVKDLASHEAHAALETLTKLPLHELARGVRPDLEMGSTRSLATYLNSCPCAQRSALAVVGRAGRALDRETPHARNLPENAARTHHPLHAVLASLRPQNHPCLSTRTSTSQSLIQLPQSRLIAIVLD